MTLLLQTDLWQIVGQYGIAGFVAGGLILVVWKVLLPIIREQNKQIIENLNEQVKDARNTRALEVAQFTKTVENITSEHSHTLGNINDSLRALTEEIRGRKPTVRK